MVPSVKYLTTVSYSCYCFVEFMHPANLNAQRTKTSVVVAAAVVIVDWLRRVVHGRRQQLHETPPGAIKVS